MESTADDRSVSRRAVLGGLAGLSTGAAVTTPASARSSAQSASELTVLTRNLYLGVDLFELFEARSLDDLQRIAGDLLTDFDAELAGTRADAIAAEIEATRPDAVALQEAAAINVQRPGDFGSLSSERATTTVFDMLSAIQSALEERGLDYEVAARTVTTDLELPAETEEGEPDVRLIDRDAVLVRSDHPVESNAATTYESKLGVDIPIPGLGELAVSRGYCAADLSLGEETVTVVSTHLSSVDSETRVEQAGELLDRLPADRPVIVGGDFNSGPGGERAAYDRLTATLADAYATVNPDRNGFTCCQEPDLRNEASRLESRVDGLLYRGEVSPTRVERVGHRSDDRVRHGAGSSAVAVWPSDHAGVVGTFAVGAAGSVETATATETPVTTRETTPTRTAPDTTAGTGPGLGVLAALVGLAGGIGGRLWRG